MNHVPVTMVGVGLVITTTGVPELLLLALTVLFEDVATETVSHTMTFMGSIRGVVCSAVFIQDLVALSRVN